ncbi:MAG: tRNA (guanosine(37)-N1)-methyltransferase TrmD [Lachnospiraceae bacterium]|nr:tRNA (guanosine(37)-N1)-methyltransferase TrmD [Lachnospiraceae bacterium]
MNFYVMTLFPEMVMGGLNNSIIKRAMEKELISIQAVNIRDYTLDKHNKVDDYPFGGGAGMLMQAQPVYDCYKAVLEMCPNDEKKPRVLYMSPQGKTFNQEMAKELAKEEYLIFLCGHYEGIDQRVLDKMEVEEVSIGDYVLTGGEFPAMVMIDTISRLVPGVLNNDDSAVEESFSGKLLEYPQYTRPEIWEDMAVPPVLMSGHHKNIEKWRLEMAIENTKQKRPDLYEEYLKESEE